MNDLILTITKAHKRELIHHQNVTLPHSLSSYTYVSLTFTSSPSWWVYSLVYWRLLYILYIHNLIVLGTHHYVEVTWIYYYYLSSSFVRLCYLFYIQYLLVIVDLWLFACRAAVGLPAGTQSPFTVLSLPVIFYCVSLPSLYFILYLFLSLYL